MIGASRAGASSSTGQSEAAAGWNSLRHWHVRLLLAAALFAAAWAIDHRVALFAITTTKHGPDWLLNFRHSTQQFGQTMGIALVLLVLWFLDESRRRWFVFAAVCVLISGGLASGLKLVAGRERPHVNDGQNVWHGPVLPGELNPDPSFPSGHTTAAFAFALCLARMYPKGLLAFVVLGTLVGLSRVLSGRHFVSDTIAGAWLGWELARILWDNRLWGFVPFVDSLIPAFAWYPACNWDSGPTSVARASVFETEQRDFNDPVHPLL